jgi:hypothetical protein
MPNEGNCNRTLEPAQRFAAQYGGTWQEAYPDGCSSIFEVGLLLSGRLNSHALVGADDSFRFEFRLKRNFATQTEEYAKQLIAEMVDRLPGRRRLPFGVGHASQSNQVTA